MKLRKLWLKFGVVLTSIAALLSMGGPVAEAASTRVVDTSTHASSCGSYEGQSTFPTLAAAVSGLTAGTVVICPGTYPAMGNSTTPGATIINATKLTIKQAVPGPENRPHLVSAADAHIGINIEDSANVTIDGLIFDSTNSTTAPSFTAISFFRSSGALRNSVVLGSDSTSAVSAATNLTTHPPKVVVTGNAFLGYLDGLDSYGPVKLTVTGNTFDGTDGGRLPISNQFGVFLNGRTVGLNAPTGTISKNTLISNFIVVMVWEVVGISVTTNLMFSNSAGVMIESDGMAHNADNNKIVGNTIAYVENGDVGIYLYDGDTTLPYMTVHGTIISKNTISSGRFTYSAGTAAGIKLQQTQPLEQLVSATITSNTFTGFVALPTPHYIWIASVGPLATSSKNEHVP